MLPQPLILEPSSVLGLSACGGSCIDVRISAIADMKMLKRKLMSSSGRRVWSPLERVHRARATIALAGALAGLVFTPRAFAQSAADRTTARSLAAEGEAALDAQQYGVAEDRFRRADALVHAPTLVVAHGRALMGLGRLVEAYERFQLVLREGTAPKDPESWQRAQEEAAELSDKVEQRIAWLTVSVAGAPNPKVEIDGRPVPQAALGARRAMDPGTREITVSADGCQTRRLKVTLGDGARRALQVILARTVKSEERVPRAPSTPTGAQASQSEQDGPILAYTMLGVGGLGILVAAVTGILTLDKQSSLDSVCVDGTCPSSAASDLDAYYALGTTSGIALAVGVAGTATGVVLLLTRPGRAQTQETQTVTGSWRLQTGPGRLDVVGTF